jgi:hypothetical protein
MALEVTVHDIEQAAIGGPGSERMKAIIAKMRQAHRDFPAAPDEADLTRAFQAFLGHKDAALFKAIDIGISAKTFAKHTKKLLDNIEVNKALRKIAARKAREAVQHV